MVGVVIVEVVLYLNDVKRKQKGKIFSHKFLSGFKNLKLQNKKLQKYMLNTKYCRRYAICASDIYHKIFIVVYKIIILIF